MPRGPKGEKRPADVIGNAVHKSLKGLSPAMAAGISATLWSMTDLAEMIDARLLKPGPRGSYKQQIAA
jgi:hypothetical protein